MKRILKFRGKSISTGEWIYGYLIGAAEIRTYITDEWDGQYNDTNVDPATVGQMTTPMTDGIYGAKVNVFEGDLCEVSIQKPRSPNYNGWNDEFARFLAVMEFDGMNPRFRNLQKGKAWKAWHTRQPHAIDLGGIKLIGNIHDNPDLLTDKAV